MEKQGASVHARSRARMGRLELVELLGKHLGVCTCVPLSAYCVISAFAARCLGKMQKNSRNLAGL